MIATAPEDMSPLSDFDDWLTTLITHEHTHILHLSNMSGLPAIINRVFGRVLAPNQTQPRFIVEGLATYMESHETAGGRMRSTQFDMYLRMAFLEDRVLTLDQLANGVDNWPHGNNWYLYGSRLMAYVARHHGDHAIAEIADTYGRNPIPYGLSRATQRATGSTWPELYDAWQTETRARYADVAANVEAARRVEGGERRHVVGVQAGDGVLGQRSAAGRVRFVLGHVQAPDAMPRHGLAHFVGDGAEVFAHHVRAVPVRLDGEHRVQLGRRLPHVHAFARAEPVGHAVAAVQAHHVVDAQHLGVLHLAGQLGLHACVLGRVHRDDAVRVQQHLVGVLEVVGDSSAILAHIINH